MVMHMGECAGAGVRTPGYLCGAPVRVGPATERGYPYVNCELRWNIGARATKAGAWAEVARASWACNCRRDWRSALLTDQDVRFARQLVHFRKPRKDQILIGVDPGKGKCEHARHRRARCRICSAPSTSSIAPR